MKRTVPLIISASIIFIFSGCQPQGANNPVGTTLSENVPGKTIRGQADFSTPTGGKHFSHHFNSKASLSEIGTQATVSLLYPSNHATKPNVTVATGLTDTSGNFTINPSVSFNPANGEIFTLKAVKRTGSAGNSVLTITTYIRWNGSGWDSITTNGIWLNTKTTALTIADHYNDSISPADCINKIDNSGGTSVPSDVGTVSAATVNEIAGMVNSLLSSDEDPVRHIGYKNNKYYVINPVNPAVNYLLTYKKCPECDFKSTDLNGVDLTGADLTGVELSGASLAGTVWTDGITCSSVSVGICYPENVIFVKADATGNNDGTNWANAYTDLQSALATATSGKDIWVAKGTYKPTTGTDSTISFQMKEGVNIYGGFDGTELRFNQRVLSAASESVLSGDLNNSGTANNGDSFHVLRGADNSVLDGFTVSFGYAGGANSYNRGGGMYNYQVSPTVSNVRFLDNYAGVGGAVYNELTGSDLIFQNVTFEKNEAGNSGGAIYNNGQAFRILNVFFIENSAVRGSGIFNNSTSPIITNAVFKGNITSGTNLGGGTILNDNSSPVITNSTFLDSISSDIYGVEIYNNNYSFPEVRNSIFSGNYNGKKIMNESGSSIKIGYSIIVGGFEQIFSPGGGAVINLNGEEITNETEFTAAGLINVSPLSSGYVFFDESDPFGPDNIPGTSDDGLRPQSFGPARNSGITIPSSDAGKDITGLSRPQGSGFDMGAYEYDE